jgi:DNA-binding transcriptional ArsR family regulator
VTNEESDGSLLLDEQLCFALYAAQRAVTAAYRPLLDELGLTYPQYLVLLVLWERGETTVKELAAALRLDYGTVSPLLKRLEAAGLVRRERSARDERSVLVAVTGRGGPARCSRRRGSTERRPGDCARNCGGWPSGRSRRRTGPAEGYPGLPPPGHDRSVTGQYLVHDVFVRTWFRGRTA